MAIPKDKLDGPAGRPGSWQAQLHKRKIADHCCWYGPDVAALRWHGLGGVGLEFPVAVGARPLSSLSGGALVVAGFSEVACPPVRVFVVAASWAPRASKLLQVRALGVLLACCSKVPSLWRGTTFPSSGSASVRPSITLLGSSRPPRGRAALVPRYAGSGRSGSLSATHSPASPPTSTSLPRAGLGRCLGLVLFGARGSHPSVTNVGPARTFYRSLHGSKLQIGIVGSGRPPLLSTGTKHWQGSSHRRSLKPRTPPCGMVKLHHPALQRTLLWCQPCCYHCSDCLPPRVQTIGVWHCQ